jgi:GT2 family glycosyltransferase
MSPELGVVVVNYRTAGLVVDCLRSLEPEVAAIPGARVVVVDNASGDGSVERIGAAIREGGWSGWATVLAAGQNRGFSAGNNVGLRFLLGAADPPAWCLLLNPDTVVRPGALRAILACGAAHPRAGIVGSSLEQPDGTPYRSAFRFPGVLSELDRGLRLGVYSRLLAAAGVLPPQPSAAARVDWVSGASLLVRRALIDDVGLMDEGYFLYYEEVDYCLRATRAGWECWHEPAGRVVHLVGKSTGTQPTSSVQRLPAYVLESRRRFFAKNHGRWYAALADAAWLTGHLAWRVRMRLQRRPDRAEPGVLGDFVRHSALWRGGGA